MKGVTVIELWRRGQAGWPRRFPIAQAPNPPLLLSIVGRGVASMTAGRTSRIAAAASTLGFGVWAWREATGGVNWFRRLLGAAALTRLAIELAGARRASSQSSTI
jgi:hypothetical protein